MTLKLSKGISSAVVIFVLIGVVIPLALDYLSPLFAGYLKLPPSTERWEVFILFGALFAVTSFCRNGYSKGDYPWLFGKIGGGLVDIALFYYIFLLLPSSLGSALGSGGIESSGLIYLVVLALVCSYGYTVFDFIDARRTNSSKSDTVPKPSTPMTATV